MGVSVADLVFPVRLRILQAVCLLIALAAVPLSSGQTSRSRERILSFDSSVTVNPDSTMDVLETIVVHANRQQIRHGILRDFPTRYPDANGTVHVVGFDVHGVTRDGKPERFSVAPWQNGMRVKIGRPDVDLAPGDYTYVISYRTDHQLGFFEDHDELYWNVTGFWPFDIDKATAHISLPSGVSRGKLRLAGYTGPQGAQGTAWNGKVNKAGVVEFATTASLRAHEGLTIVVGWPKGFVTKPAPVVEPVRGITIPFDTGPGWWKPKVVYDPGGQKMFWAALLLLAVFVAAWTVIGRDPEARSIQVVYDPPRQLSPAATRYVRRLGCDPRAFTAAVISLASKGFLTIHAESGVFKKTYTLVRSNQEQKAKLSNEEESASSLLFSSDPMAALRQAQGMAQLAAISKKYAAIGQLVAGLSSMAGQSGDTDSTRLTPSNPRIRSAYTALQAALKTDFPTKSMIRGNGWVIASGVLYVLGIAYWCIRNYPELVSRSNFQLAPLAIPVFVIGIISVLVLAGRISELLPFESLVPHRSVGRKILIAIGTVFAAGLALAFGWIVAWLTSVEWAVAWIAMWMTIGIFQRLIKSPTVEGQELWNEIEGFRTFLAEVDEDRLNRMNPPEKTPELFERMLPYAIALDCENAWAKKFEHVLAMAAATPSQPGVAGGFSPSWYNGPVSDMTNLSSFTHSFSSSFSSAIASSATVPGSSSGGGGGGSSGGGGGGGGGGGW